MEYYYFCDADDADADGKEFFEIGTRPKGGDCRWLGERLRAAHQIPS